MDFVAIDFVTANENPASLCAGGLAVVEDGRVVEYNHWLARLPPSMSDAVDEARLTRRGIQRKKLQTVPTLAVSWDTIRPYLERRVVVAYEAERQMDALVAALDFFRLPYPRFTYFCTRMIAEILWSLPDYSIASIARQVSINETGHDPQNVALTCARIAKEAFYVARAASPIELQERLGISGGRLDVTGRVPLEVDSDRAAWAAKSLKNIPQTATMVRVYTNPVEYQNDVAHLAREGWSVISVAEHRPRSGVVRIATLGLGALVFPPKGQLIVTYSRTSQ